MRDMLELVREERFAGVGVRLIAARAERDVTAERECVRPHRFGRPRGLGSGVDAHAAEVVIEAPLHPFADAGRQRLGR